MEEIQGAKYSPGNKQITLEQIQLDLWNYSYSNSLVYRNVFL